MFDNLFTKSKGYSYSNQRRYYKNRSQFPVHYKQIYRSDYIADDLNKKIQFTDQVVLLY